MVDPAAPARRGRPGHDQQAVLREAVALFIRQGYDATSMGDLARALGLSKSAIYHHVASKEQLLGLALDAALAELTEAVEAATAPAYDAGSGGSGPSAYERLRVLVARSVEVLVAHQPEVTLLLRVRGNSPVELAALERRRWIDARLADLVRAAVEEGALRDDVDPQLVSRLLFGMVNSLVEWHRPGGEVDAAVLAHAVTTLAFEGLRAPTPG
ncbi:HTH-type transcriptional repressor KstR2 [Nocardioides dokdonensis FR1436]|uniref:HTH-type transcriptional repressor KstR2 n=1 Tax=Nocardioides dokdonensis FR1436 TaxID=1300347 RepID=A0A1A9GIF6_9ACTN|nr:TetR/AcrR family transcriptional regulator [Nocardioides dokdonensis]ANH38058.1 HTH-type transcriptional repressor KstR2 [Nocardioides dokdonensis FR1436]